MPVIFENEHYQIELVSDDNDGNVYHIVNREHGVVEERVNTKPQALILAKQFDLLLTNNMWEREVNQMYGIYDQGIKGVDVH